MTLGYNGTATDYQMRAEPVLIEESAKKSGGFEGALAVVGLFVLGFAMLGRKTRKKAYLRRSLCG
jgi:hypothetical protein